MSKYIVSLLAVIFLTTAIAADPVIIDVRSTAEFQQGHVAGALHMPHDQIGELIAAQVLDKKTDIVLYCGSGRRAGKAAEVLKQLGYSSVTNAGGLKDMLKTYQLAE